MKLMLKGQANLLLSVRSVPVAWEVYFEERLNVKMEDNH